MKLLTVIEVSKILALKPATIRKMLYQKRLPVVRLGRSVRFRESDITTIIETGLREPLSR